MMDRKNGTGYLVVCASCVVLLLLICYFSFDIKGTSASFGGITGTITVPYDITYSSNWGDLSENGEDEEYSDSGKKEYMILDNMFEVPLGYAFDSWNTSMDGTGKTYEALSVIDVDTNLNLYAQWVLVVEDVLGYGDVNLNGEIDEEDYLLVEKHVLGADILTGQALINADVNLDGNVDLVDIDIIKQVYLGTDGYVGFLPSNPVLIYEVYVKEENDNNLGEIEDSKGNSNVSGSGSSNGTGTSGNGSGSTSSNGNASNGNQAGTGNNVDNDNFDDSSIENPVVVYKFEFMVNELQYANTSCEAMEDGTCELILPVTSPTKQGYTFSGWSLTKDCPTGSGITSSMVVSGDSTYYACFMKNVSSSDSNRKSYVWVVVVTLWIVAIRIICLLVERFRRKQNDTRG